MIMHERNGTIIERPIKLKVAGLFTPPMEYSMKKNIDVSKYVRSIKIYTFFDELLKSYTPYL